MAEHENELAERCEAGTDQGDDEADVGEVRVAGEACDAVSGYRSWHVAGVSIGCIVPRIGGVVRAIPLKQQDVGDHEVEYL